MAKTIEELIIFKRTALKYLLARESMLLSLGKKPMNKKIAKFVQKNNQNDSWSTFMDSLNEDLTKNLNVINLTLNKDKEERTNVPRRCRFDSTSREFLTKYKMDIRGGRMTEAPIVTVEQGQLQGRIATSPTGKAFYSFQGIPYAKPPLGSLRFKAPQPPEPWDGIRDATSEGNVSAQIDVLDKGVYKGDENCLFLNIYTSNLDGAFLPVMIFIHGGGLKFGSGNSDLYGADYLVEKDVVVVTLNYRCGALGFLSLNTPEVPGNAGLKDIVEAIRWVKENIHNFGGNSGNVTIFGESAGGVAVSLLAVSPLSKKLINKAIIQSGAALSSFTVQKTPLKNARTLANALGCESDDPEEILDFLRACSAKEIVGAHQKMISPEKFFENPFNAVIETDYPGVEAFLTEPFINLLTSGRVAQIPIMVGVCTLEFGIDSESDDLQTYIPDELNIAKDSSESQEIAEKLKQLYFKDDVTEAKSQLISDRYVKVDTYRMVQYLIQVTNKPIYYYNFDYVGALNLYGTVLNPGFKHVGHMDELGYLFRNDYQTDLEVSDKDNKMRERMLRLWTNFAKGGNPTPDESHYLPIAWLPVTKDNFYYLNIGAELTLGINPDKEKMAFWDDLYSKHFKIWDHPKTNIEETYEPPIVVASHTEAIDDISTEINSANLEVTAESSDLVDSNEVTAESNDLVDLNEVATENNQTPENNQVNNVDDIDQPISIIDIPAPVPESPKPTETIEFIESVESKSTEINETVETKTIQHKFKESNEPISLVFNNHHVNGASKVRTSNEIKMVSKSNGAPKDVIRANDPPEDDLPKNIGVNKFVNFFESLGGKK